MRQTIIIDTSALVALINPSDPYHTWAVKQWSKILPPVLTNEAVISETCFLLRRIRLIEAVFGMIEAQAIAIDFNLQKEVVNLRLLMRRYESVPMSFADDCLVRMSEQWVNSAVFTLDQDFLIYRRDRNNLIPLISPFYSE
ncbi:MAG: type II toxin-antitoxin system VapC family toxin [Microcystaceae cyanobacterium]